MRRIIRVLRQPRPKEGPDVVALLNQPAYDPQTLWVFDLAVSSARRSAFDGR